MVKDYTDWSDCLPQCHPWPQRWTSDSNQQDATMDAETVQACAGIQTIEIENDGVSKTRLFWSCAEVRHCRRERGVQVFRPEQDWRWEIQERAILSAYVSVQYSFKRRVAHMLLKDVKSLLLFGDCRCCKANVAFELWRQIETLELLRSPRLVCQIPAFKCALLLEMIGLSDTSRALVYWAIGGSDRQTDRQTSMFALNCHLWWFCKCASYTWPACTWWNVLKLQLQDVAGKFEQKNQSSQSS